MQQSGETDLDTCAYNDLALIRLDPADVAVTNPSVPFFGGPVGLRTAPTALGDTVVSYGNSSLRFGLSDLSPKYGRSLGTDSGGWNHTVYTVTPGIPGDSGSGFLDDSGNAFGVLSTVAIAPLAGSNGVGDLAHELTYAQAHGFAGLSLVPGTEPFSGAL
jgi:S1-C subfamily serine protease